ncbi:MAG: hypothetical protein AAGI51_08745 [Pseudomonadota bacterium]
MRSLILGTTIAVMPIAVSAATLNGLASYDATSSIVELGVNDGTGTITLPGFVPGATPDGGAPSPIPLNAVLSGITVNFSGGWEAIAFIFADTTASAIVESVGNFVEFEITGTGPIGSLFSPGFSEMDNGGDEFGPLTIADPTNLADNPGALTADNNFRRADDSGFDCSSNPPGGPDPLCDSYAQDVLGVFNFSVPVDSAFFAAWQPGPVNILVDGSSNFVGNIQAPDGTALGLRDSNFSLTAEVVYTYRYETDAPEIPLPAALPLLATAMGGLGFMTWRRKRA